MKIAILGYGVEGKSVLRFFRKLGSEASKFEVEIRDIKFQGKNYLKNLDRFDIVVRSPGVPYFSPEIQRVLRLRSGQAKTEITSATKLFFQNAKGILIGITGTKGKGTTATLLYQILKNSHLAAKPPSKENIHLIGNMGIPMLDELPKLKKNSISILELSSFQLQDMDMSPHIAIVLDVSPDHLNYHKNFREYLEAKTRIVSNLCPLLSYSKKNLAKAQILQDLTQRDGATCLLARQGRAIFQQKNMRVLAKFGAEPNVFYFLDNKYSKLIASKSRGKKIPVSIGSSHLGKYYSGRYQYSSERYLGRLKLPGKHNLKNALMAASVAYALGVKDKIIMDMIENFKGLPHRLEFVREKNGVNFYNDSAATNPAATAAALGAFDAPKILIAGGAGKNLDYKPIGKAIKKSNVKATILYGQNKKEIGSAITGTKNKNDKIFFVDTLQSAVKLAFGKSKKGDVIVLSPASTAFDMFSGYGERGDIFKSLVKKL